MLVMFVVTLYRGELELECIMTGPLTPMASLLLPALSWTLHFRPQTLDTYEVCCRAI